MYTQQDVPLRATSREWLGLAVLTLPVLVIGVNMTVLLLGLPRLSADLDASNIQTLWITDSYALLLAGFMITMGNLGDRFGRRRLLLIGATLLALASIGAAVAPNAETLIAFRALMGAAAATLMPNTLALIRVLFHNPQQRTTAIAVWMTTMSMGMAIGPLVGGFLLQHLWWGALFLVSLPLLGLLLVSAPRLLPEYRDPTARPVDPASVMLSLIVVVALVYAVKETAREGLTWTLLTALVTAVALGLVFLRRQRRMDNPLVELRLFRDPAFSFTLVMILVAVIAFAGNQLLLSVYLQQVGGLSSWWSGVWMMPSAVALLVGSMLAPTLARWMGTTTTLGGALLLGAVGFGLLVPLVLTPATSGTAFLLVQLAVVLAFFAIGAPTVLGPDLVINGAPPDKAGAASALEETAAELGVALGIALLGSLSVAVYQQQLGGQLQDTPPEVATAAGDSIDGAMSVRDLMDPGLLEAAREASTQGFATAGGLSAVVMAVLAVGAVLVLRNRADAPVSDN